MLKMIISAVAITSTTMFSGQVSAQDGPNLDLTLPVPGNPGSFPTDVNPLVDRSADIGSPIAGGSEQRVDRVTS
jgi:hypothetical protein